MESEKKSIFSKIPVIGGGVGESNPTLSYAVIGVFVAVSILAYLYRAQLQTMVESLLLRFHLGKPNEIQTTEISPSSRLASIIEGLGLAEEIQPM